MIANWQILDRNFFESAIGCVNNLASMRLRQPCVEVVLMRKCTPLVVFGGFHAQSKRRFDACHVAGTYDLGGALPYLLAEKLPGESDWSDAPGVRPSADCRHGREVGGRWRAGRVTLDVPRHPSGVLLTVRRLPAGERVVHCAAPAGAGASFASTYFHQGSPVILASRFATFTLTGCFPEQSSDAWPLLMLSSLARSTTFSLFLTR